MRNIKKLYAEYKEAHEATEAVDIMDDEMFDEMLERECEKLDALCDAVLAMAGGAIDEFDLRGLITNAKYAGMFEEWVEKFAA